MTDDRLVTDLRTLGLVAGDHVLIHSSLSRIGNVSGGPKTVINAVLDVLGSTGTAVFPAHTGTADISPANPPVFDVRFSETRGVGLVAETARHDPRGIRSLQPTHSVTAIGRLAEWLVEGHERCDTPCGTGSPYQKLAQVNGKILLIGCNHQANSTMHMLEEMCAVPYHLLPGVGMMRITDRNGDTRCLQGRFHRWVCRAISCAPMRS